MYGIVFFLNFKGGPLDQGDIEELGDRLLIVCPWHSFDFDLKNGQSSTGLKVLFFAGVIAFTLPKFGNV